MNQPPTAPTPANPVSHVVIMVQENHTTDNYFRSTAAYGANIATGWTTSTVPNADNPPHGRHDYYNWLTGAVPSHRVQYDTVAALPFYAWLAASGAFLENHCSGFGTNSTPNHLLIVGGQSPTLRNPPRNQPQPVWDMPSLPGHAQDNGLTWKAYTGASGYPVEFYAQLKGAPNIVRSAKPSAQFLTDAGAGTLPTVSMVWHDSPYDEHPTADITEGMNAVWQAVDAVVQGGAWDRTVFLLTWDDWGGYDDSVPTPEIEVTPDGVQLAYGPRVPLLMFGGRVRPGIDHRWCSHASLTKTALQLLALPPLGVPRVDSDVGLADLVDLAGAGGVMPKPPPYLSAVQQPPAPHPAPHTQAHTATPLPRRRPLPGRPGAPPGRHHPAPAQRRPPAPLGALKPTFGGESLAPTEVRYHHPEHIEAAIGAAQHLQIPRAAGRWKKGFDGSCARRCSMYSKVTVAGHPIHPMLIAYPVAGYTGTLVGFAVYAANGQQFWLNFAVALNIAGVGGALLAALPGFVDLAFGIPRSSAAMTVGRAHAGLNVAALALFSVSLGSYVTHWDGPAKSATLGLVLAAVGVACTIAAGFLGWMLVQDYHIGIRLTPTQERDELVVQNTRLIRVHHDRAA